MPLPVLDARALVNGTDEERKTFGEAFRSAIIRDGAVKIKNTVLADSQITKAFETCKEFFHLPVEVKSQIANDPEQSQQRGWTVAGLEKTWHLESIKNGGPAPKYNDSRESIDIGSIKDTRFPNRWLPDSVQPQHRQVLESFFEDCSSLCTQLLERLAVASGLPAATFTERCSHEASTLRSNDYPALDTRMLDAGEISRAWPHKDFGIITLVFPGVIGGLEYEDRKDPGVFHPVGFTDPNDIVVLAADTLQRWSNDTVSACVHRVQKPGPEEIQGNIAPERISLVFFCKADRHVSVGPLPHFVGDQEARYEDITALEYQDQQNKAHYTAY